MSKIIFSKESKKVLATDCEVRVFDEGNYFLIIVESLGSDKLEVICENSLIKIRDVDNELLEENNNSIIFDGYIKSNLIEIHDIEEEDNLSYIKNHPIALVSKVRNTKLLELVLTGAKTDPKLPELNNLSDEIKNDALELIKIKRSLLSICNIDDGLKQAIVIGFNYPIIWSKLSYNKIVKSIKVECFRTGQNQYVINNVIKAIPTNIAIVDSKIELKKHVIKKGYEYFKIMNKYSLAV